jgi:Zn-dependent protease
MKSSWTIARVAGVDVRVHATFLLLLAWIAFDARSRSGTWFGALSGVVFVVLLFGCVVLHELGHALAARRYGVRTRDITLLPIGGVARLEGAVPGPRAEIVIALAGPLVNLALALALALLLGLTGDGSQPAASQFDGLALGSSLSQNLLLSNLGLALFNLLPAFPMDGGRVLRAVLALRLPFVRATSIAARVGQVIAAGLAILGLANGNPLLVLIALFVLFGASTERGEAQLRAAVESVPLERGLIREFRALRPEQTLAEAVEASLASTQKDFPVLSGGALVGLLTQGDLRAGLRRRGSDARVGDCMRRDVRTAGAGMSLGEALRSLRAGDAHLLPVMRGGELIGLVDLDQMLRLAQIEGALRPNARAPADPPA